MYDIIGDIHGHFEQLKELLVKLGYSKSERFYKHSERKAIFIGDLVNRGPDSRKTVKLVRRMVENNSAFFVLGNHDYNLVTYFTKISPGRFLVRHNNQSRSAFAATLKSYEGRKEKLMDDLEWLKRQPLYLNLENLRVVHACWDKKLIKFLKRNYPEHLKNEDFLQKSATPGSKENRVIEILLSGKNIEPDKRIRVYNSSDKALTEVQLKWWLNPAGRTLKEVAFGAYRFRGNRLLTADEAMLFSEYPLHKKPLFMGHYCLRGYTGILQDNLCCVDFCCYRTGRLAAYRWHGENKLDVRNIVTV